MSTMFDRLLQNADLVLFLVVVGVLAAYSTVSDVRGKAVNYQRITAYTVMSMAFLPGVHWLRTSLRGYANVDAFVVELGALAPNQFASATLKQWRGELESFTKGQVVAGSTAEALESLARALEASPAGMQVSVLNPVPLYSLPLAGLLRAAEANALQRGVAIVHIIVVPSDTRGPAGVTSPLGAMFPRGGRDLRISFSQASNIASYRRYGSGTVYSFGNEWFAQVDILRTGQGESVRAQFSWGSEWRVLSDMFADITQIAVAPLLN